MRDARAWIAAGLQASAVAALVLGWAPAGARKAHEHGVARTDVGVEAGRITLNLELPLDDLVGFERAARTDAERAAVAAALGTLQAAAKIDRVDAAAGCGAAKVELSAPVWGVGSTPAPAPPPANQIIHVLPKTPAKNVNSMDAVWIHGRITVTRTDSFMGAASYRIEADGVGPYQDKAAK